MSGWRLRRITRRLIERGLIVEREAADEGAVYDATSLGQQAALLATLTLSISDFEPDMLGSLRAWDRKSPFPRRRSDQLL